MRQVFIAIVALCLATPLMAQQIRPEDQERMRDFDAIMGRAVKGALAEGAPADVAVLVEALRGAPGTLDPVGDWNCRTLKLGGLLPLVVYGNFRCRIDAHGDAPGQYRLVKVTGSQRTEGIIYNAGGLAIYLGVGHVGEYPANDYASLRPNARGWEDPNQTTLDPGFFEQMGPNRARLLFPDPTLESDFDILYLTR